jgi:hypothetical protein
MAMVVDFARSTGFSLRRVLATVVVAVVVAGYRHWLQAAALAVTAD